MRVRLVSVLRPRIGCRFARGWAAVLWLSVLVVVVVGCSSHRSPYDPALLNRQTGSPTIEIVGPVFVPQPGQHWTFRARLHGSVTFCPGALEWSVVGKNTSHKFPVHCWERGPWSWRILVHESVRIRARLFDEYDEVIGDVTHGVEVP